MPIIKVQSKHGRNLGQNTVIERKKAPPDKGGAKFTFEESKSRIFTPTIPPVFRRECRRE